MIRPVLAAAMLLPLWAGMVAAQDRPPKAPPPGNQVEPVRPPERPAPPVAEARAPVAAPVRSANGAAPVFGPPAPPDWWGLRETDADYAACRLALSLLGTVYEELPQIDGGKNRNCGIARPVRVSHILPDLALENGAVMRCDTARALGFWARDFLRPAAATLPDAPRVTGLRLGSTYACRGRIGAGQDAQKLSEHALGNAIDISAILFEEGAEPLPILPRTDSGDRAEAFQRAIRGAACLYFTTILGPGTDQAHDNHLHLDLSARPGGWRLCQ
ncbi:extensin family protein [Paracoccus marinaquae]|uniref:Extensin family protein n=1 Tax=Paracoccus marinaquae TaxID=2841926 RepID=A0ABS6AGC4_9RHOB|nr:extensin family protein [Paracoccus marinaquae]MBU3029648.1 extensin family protein [Paracoccus marinaquae]